MNTRIIGIFLLALLVFIIPEGHAQVSIAEKAVQKSVEVFINSEGDVHVKHTIRPSDTPRQVDLITGTVSNLSETYEDGGKRQLTTIGDNNGVLILPSKERTIVEYDLDDVLTQIDNVWTWNFRYLEETSFIFPDEVELIFSNDRPIYLGDKKGINCHGCQMILEYSINEPKIVEKVTWENKEFFVEVQSYSEIDKFIFDQPTKSISFDVSEENRFVTTVIPLELLWGPYAVFLNDEKIFFSSYINNGTHVWLNMRPDSTGEISIVGTTVVPEFPIIAPLAIGFLMILILPFIRKINLH